MTCNYILAWSVQDKVLVYSIHSSCSTNNQQNVQDAQVKHVKPGYWQCLSAVSRLHIPGHRFVVVSDPAVLPAIIGRPGLPKWAAYENVTQVGGPVSWQPHARRLRYHTFANGAAKCAAKHA